MTDQGMGVAASPPGHSDEPASSLAAVAGSVPNAELADIFRRAADLIEPEGAWTQGAFSRNADGSVDFRGDEDPDGVAERPVCWCVLGALAMAAGQDLTRQGYPIDGPLKEAVKILRAVVGEEPPDWNDNPTRKPDEVVAALREAAQGIEAATAGETREAGLDPTDESPVGQQADAPKGADHA